MPQSIYQGKTAAHPTNTYVGRVPLGWAYIGTGVRGYQNWQKIPVWNRVGNNWIQLNADLDKVDFSLTNLKFDRVTLDIHDHLNFDYLDYVLTISPMPSGYIAMPIADDTDTHLIEGLTPDTTYTFTLVANLLQGGQTNPNTQVIKTPEDPHPPAPTLSYRNATNSSITLTWTDPVGSKATWWQVYVKEDIDSSWDQYYESHSRTFTVPDLQPDTRYEYRVVGVISPWVGSPSNVIRMATGHDSVMRSGAINGANVFPYEWGAWRPDIGWYDWTVWPKTKRVHQHVYQGYWQKDPIWTGSTWGIDIPAQESGRYRGIITYDIGRFRNYMDATFGYGCWQNMSISSVTITRVCRQGGVGTINPVYMEWYLTNTDVFGAPAGQPGPPVHYGHRNNYTSPDADASHDSMGAGTVIHGLRLPRYYGNVLIKGDGVAANGIMLYRGDHANTGRGAAGYGRWCGHGQTDPTNSSRSSDWSLLINASWNFPVASYKAPAAW